LETLSSEAGAVVPAKNCLFWNEERHKQLAASYTRIAAISIDKWYDRENYVSEGAGIA
jgi:hypothetical protein